MNLRASDILGLFLALMNMGALTLLAGWAYLNAIPDWTTQAGAVFFFATALCLLNLGYAVTRKSRRAPNSGLRAGYGAALEAIRDARRNPEDAEKAIRSLRSSSASALLDIVGNMRALTADQLIESASFFQRRGELAAVLSGLSATPVACAVLELASENEAMPGEDALIRLEGLLSFIDAQDAQETVLELLEEGDARLDSLYPPVSFGFTRSTGLEPETYEAESPKVAAMNLSYEDVVSAAMTIVPIETISALSLAQRRELFSRVRMSMERGAGAADKAELQEIAAWLTASAPSG